MPLPVLLALDERPDALATIEAQLTQRYAHDHQVICTDDPAVAPQKLTELARAGEEVALALAGMPWPADTRSCLLKRVRELHPHAKRALLVPLNVWAGKPSADTVRALAASGYVDHYLVRPAASPVKRVASALGEGSIATQLAQTLLASERPAAGQPRWTPRGVKQIRQTSGV